MDGWMDVGGEQVVISRKVTVAIYVSVAGEEGFFSFAVCFLGVLAT